MGEDIRYFLMTSAEENAVSPAVMAWSRASCWLVRVSVRLTNSRLSCSTRASCDCLTVWTEQCPSSARSQEI